jgi:hypothetical protein
MRSILSSLSCVTAAALACSSACALTLQARDLDGNGSTDAYYDAASNLTWLADANIAATIDPMGNYFVGTGLLSSAESWAASANVFGLTGWRLPKILDNFAPSECDYDPAHPGTSGIDIFRTCDFMPPAGVSELADLFLGLGNTPFGGWTHTGPFINVQPNTSYNFFTSGRYRGPALQPWVPGSAHYNFSDHQILQIEGYATYAWLVRDGDVTAPVPEPETYALMLLGVGALVARRRLSSRGS